MPVDPYVIYVPVYDPVWVWGPAVYYSFPGWYFPPRPGLSFGVGISVGSFLGGGWGGCPLGLHIRRSAFTRSAISNILLHSAILLMQKDVRVGDWRVLIAYFAGRSGKVHTALNSSSQLLRFRTESHPYYAQAHHDIFVTRGDGT
jgi:hypothetical protein